MNKILRINPSKTLIIKSQKYLKKSQFLKKKFSLIKLWTPPKIYLTTWQVLVPLLARRTRAKQNVAWVTLLVNQIPYNGCFIFWDKKRKEMSKTESVFDQQWLLNQSASSNNNGTKPCFGDGVHTNESTGFQFFDQ